MSAFQNLATYISIGDFVDLFYKIEQKGLQKILSKFKLKESERVKAKWNDEISTGDFWVIPSVRKRWNRLSTGDENVEYEDYFVTRYLEEKRDLKLLSVGCGTGSRERKFAQKQVFSEITGIDVAKNAVDEAARLAEEKGFSHVHYICGDFTKQTFEKTHFDVILFNSSLHHFNHIHDFLQYHVLPLLKPDGYLVIQEYVGPNRLQWTREQLDESNRLLAQIPENFRRKLKSNRIKSRVYRPGIIRMKMIDPSEAVDSESILPAIHQFFEVVEEKSLGWNITHILLKDISQNFLGDDAETQSILQKLYEAEDEFVKKQGRFDAVFGIYKPNFQ